MYFKYGFKNTWTLVCSKSDKIRYCFDDCRNKSCIADLKMSGANSVMVLCIGKWNQFDVNKTLVEKIFSSQSTLFSYLNSSINRTNIYCINLLG